jgi:hypothetical protein
LRGGLLLGSRPVRDEEKERKRGGVCGPPCGIEENRKGKGIRWGHRHSLTNSPSTSSFSPPQSHPHLLSNNSSMNRPGTSSISPCVPSLIIHHRSTSSTTTKSRSCSWHRWSFQRSISYIRSPSTEHCPRVSCTRPSEPPHNTKFGPSACTRRFCPAAYPRFSFCQCESPATATATAATISVTTVSPTVTPSTSSATATSHKRASESLSFAEHDT